MHQRLGTVGLVERAPWREVKSGLANNDQWQTLAANAANPTAGNLKTQTKSPGRSLLRLLIKTSHRLRFPSLK